MQQAVYRAQRTRRTDHGPRGYRYTVVLSDERSGEVLARCDVAGATVLSAMVIGDEQGRGWEMTPNRRVMPSRWSVTDAGRRVVMQFDQKILGKLLNPLHKVVVTLLDAQGREVLRVMDPRSSVADQVLGVGPDEWAIVRGDTPVAKLVRLPARDAPPAGLRGRVGTLLATSDQGIVSAGERHLLAAPVALGLLILVGELTQRSGG